MRARIFPIVTVFVIAGGADAKPIITSSEETYSRICLAQAEQPDRLIESCQSALAEARVTMAQRVALLAALGDAYGWDDRHDEAESAFRAALDLDPTAADVWTGLGWTLRETDGDAAAFDAFETSLAIEVSARALAGKAGAGRYAAILSESEAQGILEAALAVSPDYAWARRELAWSHFEMRDYDSARTVFNDALRRDPDDLNARYGLGRVALREGDGLAALGFFNNVLDDDPAYFSARSYRIVTLRELGRNAQALRESDRLIADFPDRAAGYIERGLSLMALERRADALETFAAAEEKIGPDNALLYWYADALVGDNRLREALAVMDRATSLDGADFSDHLLKSYIALELQDYPLARKAAEASLATGTEDPWAHYYIAITLVHGGDISGGLERFATAMDGGLPDHRIGAFAKELIANGKYVEAVQLRLDY